MFGKIVIKRLAVIATAVACAFSAVCFSACGTVNGITLDKQAVTLEVGETEILTVVTDPEGAEVTWSSSSEDVATVDNGVITALGAGTATITAKAGDKTATCEVTVEVAGANEVTSLYVTNAKTRYNVGDTLDLTQFSVVAIMGDGDMNILSQSDYDVKLSAGNSETLLLDECAEVDVTFSYEGVSSDSTIYVVSSQKFEAEDREVCDWSPEIKENTEALEQYGIIAAGNLNASAGRYVTFNVYSSEVSDVFLTASMATGNNLQFSQMFDVQVNGVSVPVSDEIIMGASDWATAWTVYKEFDVSSIRLNKGYNTVKFVTIGAQAANIDYIAFKYYTDVTLSTATEEQRQSGTFSIADMDIPVGSAVSIKPMFGNADSEGAEVTYTSDSNKIAIEDGKITGISLGTATVKATTEFAETVFDVTVRDQSYFGTLTIEDVTVFEGRTARITPQFSNGGNYDISYSFEGSNISLDGNTVTANTVGTSTVVTATTEYGHSVKFNVDVVSYNYVQCEAEAVPTSDYGAGNNACNTNDGMPWVNEAPFTYVGNFYNNVGSSITFRVTAEQDCKAELVFSMSLPNGINSRSFDNCFDLYVNDVQVATLNPLAKSTGWTEFGVVDLGIYDLKQGENTIRFVTNAVNAANVDYLGIYTNGTVADVNAAGDNG